MLTLKRFGYGLLLTIITVALAWWITFAAFDNNLYYLAQLIPLFVAIYLLIAWFIFLRKDDSLLMRKKLTSDLQVLGTNENTLARDLPEQKITGEELFELPIIRNGLVESRKDIGKPEPDHFWRDTIFILVWAASQLALVATLFYRWFGIGSKFFLR